MTKPFDQNDRAAILAALANPDPENEIAQAVATRVNALSEILKETVAERGELPQSIDITKPKTVLDEVAISLFAELVNEQGEALAKQLGVDAADLNGFPKVRILDHGQQ